LPVFTVTVITVNHSDAESPVNQQSDDRSAWLLLDELRERLDSSDLDYAVPPRRLTGGFWADMFVLRFNQPTGTVPREVVARITPDAELSAWETTVQSGVAAQGFPTPAIHLSGGPDGPLGRAWSLMALAKGQPLLAGLSGISALVRLPRLATQLPDQLARISAQLHQLDPAPIRIDLETITGRPVDVDGLLAQLEVRTDTFTDARIDAALSKLRRTQPALGRPVVCHGDLHPFNVLADGDRLTLLDWTAAQIADPTYDLAFTTLLVSTPPLDAPRLLRPVIGAAARWVGRRFLARYEDHTGATLDQERLQWHTTLHATRILCDVAQWQAADEGEGRNDHPWHALATAMERIVDTAINA
jgi:aminoglycoside phosphotransferase (APT) family kinase protein